MCDLEEDILILNENRKNYRLKYNRNGCNELLRLGEEVIISVLAHNVDESLGRIQKRSTRLIEIGPIIKKTDFDNSGKYETGMGRWGYMTFCGSKEVTTRIICVYKNCYNNKNSSTIYQQIWRFLIAEKI